MSAEYLEELLRDGEVIEFLCVVGQLNRRLNVRNGRLFRQRRNQGLGGGLSPVPDDNCRYREEQPSKYYRFAVTTAIGY